ncbi:uncharacterized protein LOC118456895 [Anopheles albimanus]|uniref:uncharacterized protein LOC118456895 n=1 Tax=Anopheles albimanus TaxID=7167 RepID=UPI00163FB7D0|nr:uncharacterized protein LOC118456895 [Anopheles albimanus]
MRRLRGPATQTSEERNGSKSSVLPGHRVMGAKECAKPAPTASRILSRNNTFSVIKKPSTNLLGGPTPHSGTVFGVQRGARWSSVDNLSANRKTTDPSNNIKGSTTTPHLTSNCSIAMENNYRRNVKYCSSDIRQASMIPIMYPAFVQPQKPVDDCSEVHSLTRPPATRMHRNSGSMFSHNSSVIEVSNDCAKQSWEIVSEKVSNVEQKLDKLIEHLCSLDKKQHDEEQSTASCVKSIQEELIAVKTICNQLTDRLDIQQQMNDFLQKFKSSESSKSSVSSAKPKTTARLQIANKYTNHQANNVPDEGLTCKNPGANLLYENVVRDEPKTKSRLNQIRLWMKRSNNNK